MTSSVIGSISDDVLRILLPELEQTIKKKEAEKDQSSEKKSPIEESRSKESPTK